MSILQPTEYEPSGVAVLNAAIVGGVWSAATAKVLEAVFGLPAASAAWLAVTVTVISTVPSPFRSVVRSGSTLTV